MCVCDLPDIMENHFGVNGSAPPTFNSPGSDDGDQVIFVVMTVYLVLLAIVGFIGNTLVIISVAISPRLRTSSYAFIVNLGVADLSVNVIVIPVIVVSFYRYGWPHETFWCHVVCYIFYVGVGVSLFTLTAIAASRFCFVTRSQRTYRKCCGRRAVAVLLVYIWCLAFLLVLAHYWGGLGGVRYNSDVRFCFLEVSYGDASYWYVVGLLVYCSATCFLLIPFLYCMTFRAFYASQRRVQALRSDPGFVTMQRRRMRHPAEIRLTKMTALIFIILLICWTPIWVMHFLERNPPFQRLSVIVLLTNSSINPFVYAWMNAHFKRAYKRILFCGKRRRDRIKHVIA